MTNCLNVSYGDINLNVILEIYLFFNNKLQLIDHYSASLRAKNLSIKTTCRYPGGWQDNKLRSETHIKSG